LALRVRSVLRRAAPEPTGDKLADGELIADTGRRIAELGGRPLPLTVREFDLLEFFLRHPVKVWSREQLLQRVWGWQFGDQSTVTVHVRRLREKIEADPANPVRLRTVWGVGYRYEPHA
jgi:DNA-binding response OmpR family regulator